jgi:hypothetical protein
VEAKNQSKENKYIKFATLNGDSYPYSYIEHQEIIKGGTLIFEMTNERSFWGTKDAFIPTTKIEEHVIVASPFIAKGATAFKGNTEITLGNVDKEAIIYYRLGHKGSFKEYEAPFTIDSFINLSVHAQKGEIKSKTITTYFYKIDRTINKNDL